MPKHANGWERKRPAGWTPPFSFSIHNQAFVARVLTLHHANAKAKAAENPNGNVPVWDLDKALKSAARRYQKFCGNTSKYARTA